GKEMSGRQHCHSRVLYRCLQHSFRYRAFRYRDCPQSGWLCWRIGSLPERENQFRLSRRLLLQRDGRRPGYCQKLWPRLLWPVPERQPGLGGIGTSKGRKRRWSDPPLFSLGKAKPLEEMKEKIHIRP